MSNIVLKHLSPSARLYNVKCAAVLEQGNVGILGTKDADGVYTVTAPTGVTNLKAVLIAPVPLDYEAEAVQYDYQLAIGEIGRAIGLYEGLEFEIEDAQIDGNTVVGQYCVLNNDTTFKLLAVDTLTNNESVVFEVVEKGTIAGKASTTLLCTKA